MPDEQTATVYRLRIWAHQCGPMVTQPLKSTADRILTLKGQILDGTAEQVAASGSADA